LLGNTAGCDAFPVRCQSRSSLPIVVWWLARRLVSIRWRVSCRKQHDVVVKHEPWSPRPYAHTKSARQTFFPFPVAFVNWWSCVRALFGRLQRHGSVHCVGGPSCDHSCDKRRRQVLWCVVLSTNDTSDFVVGGVPVAFSLQHPSLALLTCVTQPVSFRVVVCAAVQYRVCHLLLRGPLGAGALFASLFRSPGSLHSVDTGRYTNKFLCVNTQIFDGRLRPRLVSLHQRVLSLRVSKLTNVVGGAFVPGVI
jgi:hypothetical protein